MDDTKAKWRKFWLGASPTLLFIILPIFLPKIALSPIIYLASIVYFVIGLIIAAKMNKEDPHKGAFTAGVVSGFFASFILSASLCISSFG